jgi:hypothetical protein
MVQWIAPLVIGIYVGILVDPWLRAWITQNDWARQARSLDERKPTEVDARPVEHDRPRNAPGALPSPIVRQDQAS